MNYKMMGKFLSQILIVEAGFMVPALLISLYTGSRAAVYGFGLSILITAGVGALMYYFCRNSTRRFFAREGMVCVAGSWIAISFFGCLPFVFSREIPNFVDALFEIVSGFTTTGSSILGDVEALSPGIMYWRSFSHWLGGMGVLVFLLALSPNGERGKGYTMHLLRAESPGPNVNKLVPKMRTTARILYVIYMVLTFINFLFLLLGKMPVFDAVCTAFGTAGTGGFGIQNDSIAGYSPYIQNVCTVFMFFVWNQLQLLLSAFSPACKGSAQRSGTAAVYHHICGQYSFNYVQYPGTVRLLGRDDPPCGISGFLYHDDDRVCKHGL